MVVFQGTLETPPTLRTPPSPPLIQTKIHPPVLRSDALTRERLVHSLHAALAACPLALVSAPAGYGKTTLLTSLPSRYPELPVAWLSLDEEDNDPARFLGALAASLARINPRVGAQAASLLERTHGDVEASHVLGLLINDVVAHQTGPFVLAIDDLHRVTEPSVLSALSYLFERMPAQMRVALATREDPPIPLSRWRARRQIAELRLEDLRFTPDEASAFLNETLGLHLSAEDLTLLQDRTEGWPAGVSLLVAAFLRLPRSADRGAFLAHLAHLDRYVFDFLAEEVLATRPAPMQDFLLRTSILADLTPELCAAVTGRADALDCLEEMYRTNLFTVVVDEPTGTYRYHDLFRDFLRQHLSRRCPGEVRELHRRAALAERHPWRAMTHFLAGGWWEEAALAIERLGDHLVHRASLDSLREAIEALPEAVRRAHPRLAYLLAVCAWRTWRLDRVLPLLEEALSGFAANGDEEGRGEALAMKAVHCGNLAQLEEALEAAGQALACPVSPPSRVRLLGVRAWQSLATGNGGRALADLDAALSLLETSRDGAALEALAAQFHALFLVLPGGIERAERFRRLLADYIGPEDHPLRATVAGLTAWIALWRGNWDETLAHAERGREISERYGGLWWLTVDVEVPAAICAALRGDEATAAHRFDAFYGALAQPGAAAFAGPWLASFLFFLGRVHWLQGRMEEAREVYHRMRAAEGPGEWPSGPLARRMMRGLLDMEEGRFAEAEASLRESARRQAALPFSRIFGDARTLLAHLYRERGKPREAMHQFGAVLAENEEAGLPGRVLWDGRIVLPLLRLAIERGEHAAFAGRVLGCRGQEAEAPPARETVLIPRTGEVLSAREVEVLRLIAEGRNNPAIAEALVISVHTVKRHVANLLGKLGVSSRTEAAVLARDLGVA